MAEQRNFSNPSIPMPASLDTGFDSLTSLEPMFVGARKASGSGYSTDPPEKQKCSPREIPKSSDKRAANDLLLKCSEEVKENYKFSNVLKIALRPTTKDKIFGVEELHVPVTLKKSIISPDLPDVAKINPQDVFNNALKKILLYGPPGVGKTTELKMWLHGWSHSKEDNPLRGFAVVFYIDAAQLTPGSSLGEAIKNQCLPANTEFSAARLETMCRERQSEILVILDNYKNGRKRDQASDTSSLFQIVQLKDFLSMGLLVATTSGGVGDFRKVYGNYNHVKVDGISEDSVSTYVQQMFKKREDKEFESKVQEFIEAKELAPVLASSPVLLSIICQIVKWHELPTELEGLKTTSALIDKIIECVTEESDGYEHDESRLSDQCEPHMYQHTHPIGNDVRFEAADEDLYSLPRSLIGEDSFQSQTLSKRKTLAELSVVAFNCYLKGKYLENLQLSDADFDVCGDLKKDVMKEGCRLGIMFMLGEDKVNPSSYQAAQGNVIKFLSPLIQQKLAAKYFSKLLESSNENTPLQKICTIDDALSLRNLLLFSCGESIDAARHIISHVVNLTQAYANQLNPDPREEDGVIREAHGLYHYLVEFILELNYEAQSDGRLNDTLRPLVTNMRILSPTVILTRSLSYFLEYTAPLNGPHLGNIGIKLFDVKEEIRQKLPSPMGIGYSYKPRVPVQVEREESSNQSEHPNSQCMPVMSIKVDQTTYQATRSRTIEAEVEALNMNTPDDTEILSTGAGGQGTPSDGDDAHLPFSISAEHDRGTFGDGKSSRVIQEIQQESIQIGDDPVAEGRFGQVYKATYQGKEYALKRIRTVDSGNLKVAIREIKLNGRVSHPNIVVLHFYSIYQLKDMSSYRVELLMDYINGYTLQQAIFDKRVKYLETSKGQVELALKVSGAIAHIHANGCIHSDIKPNNILIKIPENEPYVCDFGLGHRVTHSALSTLSSGKRYGVQRWMPPEFSKKTTQGYVVSCAGDIWSLACTLLEVFTRRMVWEEFTDDWPLITRLQEDSVVPDLLRNVQNESIRDTLRRCFVKDQNQRPAASVLVAAFEEALRCL